jgi:hypothetical protein
MAGILDTILGGLTKQYDIAMPAVNFVRGLALGPQEALMTPSMQLDLARRAESKGGDKGALGYEDFGLDVTQPMGRFTGGLFSLDPTAFANVGSAGRVTYEKDPTQFGGYKYGSTEYNFTPDKDTGSTGNKILDFINEGGLAQKLANKNLSNTLSNLAFTSAYGDIPTKEERDGLYSFNNLVSDTVIAEPRSQFQDYPGDKNLGSVQDQNLGFDYNFDENVLKEEEDAQYNLDNKGSFNMEGILQSLGGFAKNTAGRYIGSQALGGAGGMMFGPIGGLVGGIIGALKGGDLFNQNTYSQQMYNNLTSQGQGYVDRLYGPGGVLQGYNQFSAFGKGALGTIANNLSKYPNMSPARRNAYRTAADKYISGIDPTQQGYNAVTKKGGYGYDDAYINYAPPSGGKRDSGSGDGWSGGSSDNWGGGFDSDQATL